jgi:hypothetical protein
MTAAIAATPTRKGHCPTPAFAAKSTATHDATTAIADVQRGGSTLEYGR